MTGMTAGSGLREVAARLAAAGVASPEWDARVLLERAGSTGDLETSVRRRVAREPLQHITGIAWFRHLALAVGPGVFVPRPETELVVDAALDAIAAVERPLVVDLCAGSGAIGLSIAHERAAAGRAVEVHLVEADPGAVPWLRRNTAAIAADSGVVHETDLADDLGLPRLVDVVTANPPYLVEGTELDPETAGHDPAAALWGGTDGLDVIRPVIGAAARLLRPGGTLVVEHDSTHDLAPLLTSGWHDVQRHDDLTGRPRYSTAVRA